MPEISSFVESYKYLKVGGNGRTAIYRKLRERQKLHDRLYWVDMASKEPKDDLLHLDPAHFTSPFLVPRARLMIEYPVNRIAMDKFTVTQEPLLKGPKGAETKTARKNADTVEKWGQAILDTCLVLPVRSFTKSVVKDGEGYFKQVLDTDVITDKNYKGNPLSFVVPSSRMVYASLDRDELNRPFEVYEERVITARKARELAKQMNKGEAISILPDVKEYEYVIWVEGWTDHDRLLFAIDQQYEHFDAVPITEEKIASNPYGYSPYVRAFTGYGEESPSGDPADMAVSILTGWERAIIGEGRDRTILDSLLAKHALPILIREWEANYEPGEADKEVDLAPGTPYDAVHHKARLEPPPPIPPALLSQLNDLKELFEAFQPGSISGSIGGKNEPAVGRNIMISQANMQNSPVYIAVKTALANVLGMALETVEKVIGANVEMRGYTLKPQDINGNYKVNVEIRTGNPDERARNLLLMKDLWPFLGHEYLLQEMGDIADAAGHLAKKAAEEAWDEFKRTPAGQQLVWQKVFKDIDDEEALEALRASQTLPAAPAQGQPAPTGPEGPQGIGGSPTRNVAPMVSMEVPVAGQ